MTPVNPRLARISALGSRPPLWQTILLATLLGGVASIPLMMGVATWWGHMQMRQDWAIHGPACRLVSEVPIASRGAKPPQPFTYMGVTFARQIGNVSCAAVPDDGWMPQTDHPVCQFNAPGAVAVTAGGRTVVYESGVGRPATITFKAGKLTCVIGGGFRNGGG